MRNCIKKRIENDFGFEPHMILEPDKEMRAPLFMRTVHETVFFPGSQSFASESFFQVFGQGQLLDSRRLPIVL